MAPRIWGSLCDPPGSNVQLNSLLVLYSVEKHSAVSLWLSRGQDLRIRHGAEVLTRKEKNRQRFTLCQPLPGPAQRHKHVFVLPFGAGITQQPTIPLARQRSCKKVTEYPRAGWPPRAVPGMVQSRGRCVVAQPMYWKVIAQPMPSHDVLEGHCQSQLARLGTRERSCLSE